MSSRSATVRAAQECAILASTGWRRRHASRKVPLDPEHIDVSASQTGLHRFQARNVLFRFSGPPPTLTEAVLG